MAVRQSLIPDTPGRRIRYLRRAHDLTQTALAARLGVSQPTLNRWEKDRRTPSLAQQRRLAEYFNVSRFHFEFDEDVA